jgi:hypothetical protein
MDLAGYRKDAERFCMELSREHYRHFAGLQPDLRIEPVYARHARLFARSAVEELRDLAAASPPGDERRRLRALLDFAVEGCLGQATKATDAEVARREAALELDVDGERLAYREAPAAQAAEPDRERRARVEEAHVAATARELNPLRREALETHHALARDLGWTSYAAMCADVKGIDLETLGDQATAFLDATGDDYRPAVDPEARRLVGVGLDGLRRSDLPWLYRDPTADARFPAERLVRSFSDTLAGLGIDLEEQANVVLDVETRPTKSPRAFCAPARVPEEVYLVVPPMGGREDYSALFHEGGHAEHYGCVEQGLAFEFRHLGDNSVTEAFAFLFERLLEDPEWLRRHLGVADPGALASAARARWLILTRRYCAKLGYELALHGEAPVDAPGEYTGRLTAATGIPWPGELHLVDVDPGFYAAAYLRAWTLETQLRARLRARFGPAWFDDAEAGDWLRSLWSQGQRLDAAELLDALSADGAADEARAPGLDLAGLAEDLLAT